MVSESGSPHIQLVGGLYQGDPEGFGAFFGTLFPRLTGEVRHTGSMSRFVSFASGSSASDYLLFAGIEVEKIEDVPEGMLAWDLEGDRGSISEGRKCRDEILWQGELSWLWCDQPASTRPVGEFRAECPPEWRLSEKSATRDFRLQTNSYLAVGEPCDDEVHLVDYNPAWPEGFETMRCWLQESLPEGVALRIEHYGSTSIPGIPAKPIIDILVEVPSFEQARQHLIPLLNRPECEYWWYSGHMCFIVREKLMGRRTHHLHVAPSGHRLWEGLAFRDYLRAHPEDAARYAALKRELAEKHRTDREAYTDAKSAFVREIAEKARR